ncbi:MAG TPA: SDR family oxidoreductase [Flavisolibacter sp.]|jgi:hypothetical protein|nr:SDR family oxidoreductase [Flavisolibacter sp.]
MPFALITGASKGIGKAIAFELAARKLNVLLVARSGDLLNELALELKKAHSVEVHTLAIDLSQPDAAHQVYEWSQPYLDQLQVLVNNAGYGLSGRFEAYPLKDHLQLMQLNMNVVVACCHLFIPYLKKQKQAYILNIASSAAYQAVPYLSVYAATKSFVLQFSRALRYELKRSSISVTCISPGATDTGFNDRANLGEKAVKAAKKLEMTPEQVADIAVTALFAKKTEVITGFINKLGAAFVWLLPKKWVENTAAKIYE